MPSLYSIGYEYETLTTKFIPLAQSITPVTDSEARFYSALKDVFVGAKVEGKSGYINLMRIKNKYFEYASKDLKKEANDAIRDFPEFREEMYEKLYSFFKRYFSESGSIYFVNTPFNDRIYDQVYTDRRDVVLFWKTNMLYYVKSDILPKNMTVTLEGSKKFHFDVTDLEHKKANEKKELLYDFKEVKRDGTIVISVTYSEKGRKTKVTDLVKKIKENGGTSVEIEDFESASRIFELPSSVDYFINKDAKKFLKEQFDLWLYQYEFSDKSVFTEKRVKQLKALQAIAYAVIEYVAKFENEVVKIWNKPKFVLNSNYVITLDRIAAKDIEIVEKILKSPNFKTQANEWKELGIANGVKKEDIINNVLTGKQLNKKFQYLPIDTRYFKDLEGEIISKFDNLDAELDGHLIKSENYQALNTILEKYKNAVKTIYIDPPFNKEQDADYAYSVKFKDATWITILENRIRLARNFLSETGSIFVRCDYNGNAYVRLLMDQIFGRESFGSEIIVNRFKRQLGDLTRLNVATESLFYYAMPKAEMNELYRKRMCTFCGREVEPAWRPMHSPGLRTPPERVILGRRLLPPKGRHWTFTQERIDAMTSESPPRIRINDKESYVDLECNRISGMPEYLQTEETPIDSNWTDLKGYAFAPAFSTRNAEELIERALMISSGEGDLVMDFFLGSGTTTAVAHKLRRKWIGVEMGSHFYTDILPRMKRVLAGEQSEISKEVNWRGGGFFKYYELEQYEDALRNLKYEDSDPFHDKEASPYNQYIFLKDTKLLKALEIDSKKGQIRVDLSKLYEEVDIAETLSHLFGKKIKRIQHDEVHFGDGESIDLKKLDYKYIKPLIWWNS